ncbi:MAG TPA: LacI family DNA-binding transcriptional regulator [Fimbriimonas sp.]|nr:LacI family DNA-binding transcriptional regulator [Fimbriimonas sp.]
MGVTLKDVAKEAGTSVASVSATLHGTRGETIRVGQATRDRIKKAALSLGYVANPIAKSLATGKSRTLGLMLPYVDAFRDENPFCAQVMHGVLEEVVNRHYNLMLYTAASDAPDAQTPLLVDSRVDGIVLVMPEENSAIAAHCDRQGIPYVSVLQRPGPGRWCVNADDYRGGRLAARRLWNLGHRRVAHLTGSMDVATSAPRRDGFCAEMKELGCPVPEFMVVPSGFTHSTGYESMKILLNSPREDWPTGVFAANDQCAEGAMRAIRERKLSIPEDLAVIGYDDTWYAGVTQPPLTSVHMPISEMGSQAVGMLIDRLEGREVTNYQPLLSVHLTIRQSCSPFSPASTPGTPESTALIQ